MNMPVVKNSLEITSCPPYHYRLSSVQYRPTYAPHFLWEGLLVAHDLSVVVDGVELAGLDEEGDVARLERREHPGDVRNVDLARAELDLHEENGQIFNSAASLI